MTRWHDVSSVLVCSSVWVLGRAVEAGVPGVCARAQAQARGRHAHLLRGAPRPAGSARAQPLTQGTKLLTDRLLSRNSGVIVNCLHEEKIPKAVRPVSCACMEDALYPQRTKPQGRCGMQDADAQDRDGDPVVVAVGAHYRSQALTKEDLLLHVVNVSPLQGCRPSPAECMLKSLSPGQL